ncbi:hypothetical protein ACRAQ7_03905 [Erythrobacter sp. W53]|uniref:hypothetical protein n=1 Tax=Erythrobacter sp. W53 TaxID=3425947 RepID=UPI003D768871
MHYIVKTSLAAASAFALTATFAASAKAPSGEDILVNSPKGMAKQMESWRQNATRDLNRKLELADRFRKTARPQGIVQVRFELDQDGRAVNMWTQSNTAGTSGEKAAKWAIRRMRSLDDAPGAGTNGRTFQANIIFATSLRQKEQLAAKLGKMERSRLAAGGAADAVVILGS